MRDVYLRSSHSFLIVYAINSRSSFEEVEAIRDQILRIRDAEASSVGIVLIGNKCDLHFERQVSIEEGESLAARWGVPFFETSAKVTKSGKRPLL